jgi:hypothetical protein
LVAIPEATGLVPSDVAPLKNSTMPAAPPPVTEAVSVALAGATAVAGDTGRAVVVVTATGTGAVTTNVLAGEVLGVKAAALVGMKFAV